MLYFFVAICFVHAILAIFLIEPHFTPMSAAEFKEKISISIEMIKQYKLYFFLGLLFILRAAPHIEEPIDYYLTNDLNFSSTYFTLKNVVLTLSVVIGVYMIKKHVFDYYNKTTLVVLNTLMLLSVFVLFIVTRTIFDAPFEARVALGFIGTSVFSFAFDSIKLIMFNIYITFCPKNVEATFATFFFFIDDVGRSLGLVFQNVIVFTWQISKDNNDFEGIGYLILGNMCAYVAVYFVLYAFDVPSGREVEDSVIYEPQDLKDMRADDDVAEQQSILRKQKHGGDAAV